MKKKKEKEACLGNKRSCKKTKHLTYAGGGPNLQVADGRLQVEN